MYRNGPGKSREGVDEAVKIAGGKTIQKFVRETPKSEEERKLKAGAPELRQRFADDGKGGMTAKTMAIPKKKTKKKPKKHKRSKIDEVLGDDTY